MSYSDTNADGLIAADEVLSENNYYPFGLQHQGDDPAVAQVNKAAEKYKYNSKELQDELGINFYDYGARNYDAALGRWMNVDPLAEQFPGWTPYHYVHNNPINLIDPTGMSAESAGPPKTPMGGGALGIMIIKAFDKAITKYNLLGAGGFVFYNGKGGASGEAPLARKAHKDYQPDYIDAAPILQIASMFGPGGAKVSKKEGATTVQDIFRNFAAGVEKGKQVESKINSIEALDKASDIVTMKLKEVTFNIFNKDGKTESIEQVSNEVIFTGSAEKVVKQADSLENANISRKERIEKW